MAKNLFVWAWITLLGAIGLIVFLAILVRT